MIVECGKDPMPPLSAFPKETQETVMRILEEGARRTLQREAEEAQARKKAESNYEST